MILGSCSICKGPVELPDIWHGIFPPTPSCSNCGALPSYSGGPIIPMVKSDVKTTLEDFIK